MRPKKSLGQNFLNNKKILTKIVECGNISINDTVLEIGPGTGNLTKMILEKNPKKLFVVEKDELLSKMVIQKFGSKLTLINKDILNCYDEFKFNSPIKVFGNLPYNISTEILISFLKIKELNKYFDRFVFLFQKEVANRILAEENSKEYGRLSILTSWKMEKFKITDVEPKYFYPKPKVLSSVICLKPKSNYDNLLKSENLEYITNVFFNKRRKMIGKPMKKLFQNYDEIAKKLDIDLKSRPQNLSNSQYFEICKIYEELL